MADVATVGPDFTPIDLVSDGSCVFYTIAPRSDATAPGAVVVAPAH